MIEKQRPWADTVELDPRWKPNGRLARHRPYFFYEDDALAPCDNRGYRVPTGFASVEDKYAAANGTKVFCYGGSTTFGVYCAYDDAYPARLEAVTGHACFNMGLQTFDLYANLLGFVDHLRGGLVPDLAIFVDGVNENQGFVQAVADGSEDYAEEFRQYRGFRDLILNASLRHRLKTMFGRGQAAEGEAVAGGDPCRFAAEQAAFYMRSLDAVERIAGAYGVRTRFLLQPAVWNVWPAGANDPRFVYLQALYGEIAARAGGRVTDISAEVPLTPENFYDWAHLDAEGNAHLAATIATKVF
jgi:hypothetical protein